MSNAARRRGARAGRARTGTVRWVPLSASDWANSAALANRSAGSFSSAVSTAASTCGGMV